MLITELKRQKQGGIAIGVTFTPKINWNYQVKAFDNQIHVHQEQKQTLGITYTKLAVVVNSVFVRYLRKRFYIILDY